MRSKLRQGVFAALLLATSGCNFWYDRVPSPDQLWYVVPWFDHMIKSRYVHPYSRSDLPRNTVEGSVPVGGGEADWATEWAAGKTTTADRLVNPLKGGAAPVAANPKASVPHLPSTVEARGDTLYQTFCAVCHGMAGAADGPVSPKVGAPSLLTDRARSFSDGYLYSIVRYGRGVMPRYGDKIHQPTDRWAVVQYVRSLQAGAAAPAGGR